MEKKSCKKRGSERSSTSGVGVGAVALDVAVQGGGSEIDPAVHIRHPVVAERQVLHSPVPRF